MHSACGNYVVVFNGEIYNYVELREECRAAGATFCTQTDTEVLLWAWKLWGADCLPKLKGMFAFVLVDRREGAAVIVRDFFGIKPLYYAETETEVVVCSEVMPILKTGRFTGEMDRGVAFEYLRFGTTGRSDQTIFTEIRSLPSAHASLFDFKTGTLGAPRRYWELDATPRPRPFADAVEECRQRFVDNVRLHMRSDVPVGATLSGGLDSSSVVSVMRLLEPDLELNTFSYVAEDPRISEERWVDKVHDHVGGVCHKIRPVGVELERDFELMTRRQGEPLPSASVYAQFRVFQRAHDEGVPVTLDGQGADELLAGYSTQVGTEGAARFRRGDWSGLYRLIVRNTEGIATSKELSIMILQCLLSPAPRAWARRLAGRGFLLPYLRREWFEEDGVDLHQVADALVGRFDNLNAHLKDTVVRGSLPSLLRYVDRNSMAFSVESRVPFLTHDFAQFLVSLPATHLISRDGTRKHVFREAMRGIVPEPIRTRPDKIGFLADDARWLRANRAAFSELLHEVEGHPAIEARPLRRFLDAFWAGRDQGAQLVWRLVSFGYWLREVDRARQSARITRHELAPTRAASGY
jgi:asparagine synthase (glutamine-hydrolysing)